MRQESYSAVIKTPVGKIGITAADHVLLGIEYLAARSKLKDADNAFTENVIKQLQAYFDDPTFEFDIAYDLTGTPYQKRVWNRLKRIRSGQTLNYSDVAKQLKSGPRAVGGACRNNPISIIIPCHRVISKSGIGGYSGDWETGKVDIKRWLLNHENVK